MSLLLLRLNKTTLRYLSKNIVYLKYRISHPTFVALHCIVLYSFTVLSCRLSKPFRLLQASLSGERSCPQLESDQEDSDEEETYEDTEDEMDGSRDRLAWDKGL